MAVLACKRKLCAHIFPLLYKVGNVGKKGLHSEELNKFSQKVYIQYLGNEPGTSCDPL